jgi:hypothetical protein
MRRDRNITDTVMSLVDSYKKIGFNQYELTLSCGHLDIRVPYRDGHLPERVICSECYKETHDKNGNKI